MTHVGDIRLRHVGDVRYWKAEVPLDEMQGIMLTKVGGIHNARTEVTGPLVKHMRAIGVQDKVVFYDVEGDNYIVYDEWLIFPRISKQEGV